MLNYFADDSQFTSHKNHPQADVFLFGGIAIEDTELSKLRSAMHEVKAKHMDPRAPIKWNIRSLKDAYEKRDRVSEYKHLLKNSEEIRRDVIKATIDVDYKIIISVFESFLKDPQKLKEKREELSIYPFVMSLIQFGFEVRDSFNFGSVYLDWPEGSDNSRFNKEYAYGFTKGQSSSQKFRYHCGKLSSIGFADSLYFATMIHSGPLQLADMVLGATKDFLESMFKPKKGNDFKREIFDLLEPKFRGYPNHNGKGLIVSTNAPRLHKGLKLIL